MEFNKQIQEARKNPKLKDRYILPTFIIKFNIIQKKEIVEEAFINSFNIERLEQGVKDVIVRNENITFKKAVERAIKSLSSLRKTLERSLNKNGNN